MAITLDLSPALELTDLQFEAICRRNRDLRLEKTATGEIVVMPPTGGDTGERNSSIIGQLWLWNRQQKLANNQYGRVFDSSTGFRLPNGATRSPDAAWLQEPRWQQLTPAQRQAFLPLCPDFAIELKSPSDDLSDLRQKFQEYLANGLQLGWLINPENSTVEIYRPDTPYTSVTNPNRLSADPLLPGFTMAFDEIFNANS
ncbi:MAG: Uma2 family endonuclease [Cyanobacteria bacterium J06642_9]